MGAGFPLPFKQDDSNQEMMDFSPRSGQERTALVMTMLGKLRRRKACVSPIWDLDLGIGKFGRSKILGVAKKLSWLEAWIRRR